MLLLSVYSALERKKKRDYFYVALVVALMVLTQPVYAGLLVMGMIFAMLFYVRLRNNYSGLRWVFVSVLLGGTATAPWLYQAILNGVFERVEFSVRDFSFGIIPFFAIGFLALFAQRKSRKSIFGAICLMLLSLGVYINTLQGTTLGTLVFNSSYATVAYLFLGFSFILWEHGKKRAKFVFWMILFLGCVPGIYGLICNSTGTSLYEQQKQLAKENGLEAAMERSDRRMILLGLGEELSFPAYFAQINGREINFSYNLTNQGAVIGENLELLNYALYSNNFEYMFDRCLLLGNDTVIIKKEGLEWQSEQKETLYERLIASAERVGYSLHTDDEYSYLFYQKLPFHTGIVTSYEGIAIGENSSSVTLLYPIFCEGHSDSLEEYSLEELLEYRLVFLSGFRYNNKEEAEELVRTLAKNGVKVFIDMDGIPENIATNRKTFLGVTAQDITFWGKYPDLILKNKVYKPNRFYQEYTSWGTVYVQNAESIGYAWVDNKPLCFFGEADGVYFIGFEILEHVLESDDAVARELLEEMFSEKTGELPHHAIYSVSYEYDGSQIKISAPVDRVNTSLAFQPSFLSEHLLIKEQNLLVVNQGVTTITFSDQNISIGLIIFVVEVIAVILFLILKKKNGRKQYETS